MTEARAGSGFPTLEQAQNPAYSETRFRSMLVVTSGREAAESARAENSPAHDRIYRASWDRDTYTGLISIRGGRSRCIRSMLQAAGFLSVYAGRRSIAAALPEFFFSIVFP